MANDVQGRLHALLNLGAVNFHFQILDEVHATLAVWLGLKP